MVGRDVIHRFGKRTQLQLQSEKHNVSVTLLLHIYLINYVQLSTKPISYDSSIFVLKLL